MRGAKQNGLRLQSDAGFAVFQHPLNDVASLARIIGNTDELGTLRRRTIGPEILREPFRRQINDRVGSGQDGLGRAVVALERDNLSAGIEVVWKLEDVASA